MTTKTKQHSWHPGMMNGYGRVFADEGRMELGPGGTTLTPICTVHDFHGDLPEIIHLIAAAPKLQAALQRLLVQAELTSDYGEAEHGTLRSACKQAQAALDLSRTITMHYQPDQQPCATS